MSAERVVVEALDGHGRIQWRERVALDSERRTFTIGRSPEADVALDDPYAAALHASVEVTPDGRLLASDLGSVNGLIVGGKHCGNACGLALPDNTLQVGRTHLRVRTGHEPLAPEKPYRLLASSPVRGPAWIAAAGAVASGLQLFYMNWLGAPRDLTISLVTSLSLAVSIAAVWVAFWALLSRIMQGEWRWLRHAAIYLCISAGLVAVMGVVDLGGFMLALPLPSNRHIWIGAVALAVALFLHLTHASNLAASRAAVVACGIPLLLAAGSHWLQGRSLVRDVNYIGAYMRIYPPALRLRSSDTLEDYFNTAGSLRGLASKALADAIADEPTKDKDGESD
jgi:hypothetical protein